MNLGYYDVLMENFTLKPLILAMSEVDAMHIAEVNMVCSQLMRLRHVMIMCIVNKPI